jgi:phosphoribosylcarboxyaminoimidazole (NCAIR) mutase
MEHLIKTTTDGRSLKVIGTALYLDGVKEADALDPVILHPNKERILAAAPDATHMAGRVPLTRDQALAAQAALIAAREVLAFSPQGIAERIRLAQKKAMMERD